MTTKSYAQYGKSFAVEASLQLLQLNKSQIEQLFNAFRIFKAQNKETDQDPFLKKCGLKKEMRTKHKFLLESIVARLHGVMIRAMKSYSENLQFNAFQNYNSFIRDNYCVEIPAPPPN